jgi:molybdate transport system substrate-binding protein
MSSPKSAAACLAAFFLMSGSTGMYAAEIVIISTTASKEALVELIPLFERASGYTVAATYGPGSEMGNKIRSGLTGDLLIAPSEFTDPLMKEGRIVAGSRVDFALSGSAVAVRAGAPKPEIGSSASFKQALIAARTVSYSRGASGLLVVDVIERLGIADLVKQKTVVPEPGELVGAVVARGAAELGIQQLSELLPVSGIEIVGPLPAELQRSIVYGVSVLPGSKEPEAARAFVVFLRSPTAASVLKKKGMDPS